MPGISSALTIVTPQTQWTCTDDCGDLHKKIQYNDVLYWPNNTLDLSAVVRTAVVNTSRMSQGSAFYVISNLPCDNMVLSRCYILQYASGILSESDVGGEASRGICKRHSRVQRRQQESLHVPLLVHPG